MKNPRRPQHENLLGTDKYTMQSLQSMLDKYTKDYLSFFYNLANLYKEGSQQNREIKEILILVSNTCDLLETIIASGSITAEDSKKLIGSVKIIEEKKQESLEEIEKTQNLQEGLEKVIQTTGVSREDLGVSEEVAKTGLRMALQAQYEQPSMLRRTAGAFRPALEAAGRLGGKILPAVGMMALGPFYPIAKMLAREEIRERHALKTLPEEELQPEVAEGGWEDRADHWQTGDVLRSRSRRRRRPMEIQAAPLMWFFEHGAYQAKWTKELLAAVRGEDFEGKRGGGGLGGTLGAAGIAGVVAAALPVVAGAAAGALPILAAEKAYAKYTEVLAEQYKALENNLDVLILNYENYLRQIERFKKDMDETMRIVDPIKAAIGEREELLKAMPEKLERDPFAMDIEEMKKIKKQSELILSGRPGETGISSPTIFVSPVTGEVSYPKPEISAPEQRSTYPVPKPVPTEPSAVPNLEQPLENLNKAIESLMTQIRESGAEFGPRIPISGDAHDSGDVLIQELAAGHLTLGGW